MNPSRLLASGLLLALLSSCVSPSKADLVVAVDGSGNFKTVQAAIDAAPANSAKRTVILVRRGIYPELVVIPTEKKNLTLRGEDRHATIIAATNNAKLNPNRRELISADADGLVLENLTLHNTTPYHGTQAETIHVLADRVVLRDCDFLSFQDTLRLDGRVFVDNCYVEGDVDFVWGAGTVYFNRCELKALHDGYLVQSRNGADKLGYIFVDCRLTGVPDITKYVLARVDPGRFPFSHVAFIQCAMDKHILSVGWVFDGPGAAASKEHIRFEEFQSTDLTGKPLDVAQRIAGSRQLTADEAARERDVVGVFGGWNPLTPPP